MRKGTVFIWILLLLNVNANANTVGDQGDNAGVSDTLRQVELEEVQVTARRKPTAVIPVQTLQGQRLTELSAHSVADALRYFSGVQIKDFGGVGGLKTVDIRSMGTHHLGVFYDGIEIGNAQNGTVDLGKFSMDNIEEISLYNGQKSEIFQSAKDYGSAGTLYIRARRPRFEQGKNYHLLVSMKAGTFGLANPSFLYEHRLCDAVHLSVSGEYTYAHGRYHFRYRRVLPSGLVAWDTTAVRENGDVQAYRAEAGLYGYLPQGKWSVKGYCYGSEKGIPGAIVNNVWKNSQRQWDRNAFVQGNFTHEWDKYSLLVNAKYSNDYMRYLNPDTTLMYLDNHFTQQEAYVSMAHKYSVFDWWDVSLSADYQFNTLASDQPLFVHPSRHTGMFAAATAMHYRWLRLQASVLATVMRDHTDQMDTLRTAVSPAVFVSYQPLLNEQFFIRAFYKHVFRMPTFNDLYYTDMGNILLRPERAVQYDLGAQYSQWREGDVVRQYGVKMDGYFNQIRDKIVAIPKGNGQYRWQMMNIGYVEILGVDVNADVTLVPKKDLSLTFAATYTYQQARDLTDKKSEFYGGQIAYIPRHSTSATANITWRTWSLNYSFIYVGERYHNSANIPANYEQPWYTHDLSLAKIWRLPAGRLTTTLEVNNMLNQQYEVILNYPMPGINGRLAVKYEL